MIVTVPLCKTNSICCLTACDDNLLDPQLTRSLNHIVRTQHVPLEALVIRHQHISRVRREMYDRIDRAHGYGVRVRRIRVIVDMEVGCKGIENLAGVCEVCLEGVNRGVGEWGQVKVEDGVTFGDEMRDHVPACFP